MSAGVIVAIAVGYATSVGLLVAALWALDLRSSKRTEKVHERLDHLDTCVDELKLEQAQAHARLEGQLTARRGLFRP